MIEGRDPKTGKTVFLETMPQKYIDLYMLLKKDGPLTRTEIITFIGTAWTTTFDRLDKLRELGFIESYRRKVAVGIGTSQSFWRIRR